MAAIVKTPSGTWKALIRKTGWPATAKTFRAKLDAEDWARRTEDEMVRGGYIQHAPSERMTIEDALKRYLSEVSPTRRAALADSDGRFLQVSERSRPGIDGAGLVARDDALGPCALHPSASR